MGDALRFGWAMGPLLALRFLDSSLWLLMWLLMWPLPKQSGMKDDSQPPPLLRLSWTTTCRPPSALSMSAAACRRFCSRAGSAAAGASTRSRCRGSTWQATRYGVDGGHIPRLPFPTHSLPFHTSLLYTPHPAGQRGQRGTSRVVRLQRRRGPPPQRLPPPPGAAWERRTCEAHAGAGGTELGAGGYLCDPRWKL